MPYGSDGWARPPATAAAEVPRLRQLVPRREEPGPVRRERERRGRRPRAGEPDFARRPGRETPDLDLVRRCGSEREKPTVGAESHRVGWRGLQDRDGEAARP